MDLQSLAADPLVTLGGFVFGLLGVVLAIIFSLKSRKEKLPCYETKSDTLIEGLHQRLEGLQLQYKGTPQERVSVTKVAVWNAGRETIDQGDVVSTIPFGIMCPPDIELLDVQVVSVSDPATAVSVLPPEKCECGVLVPLKFDYLDHDDFAVIQIVHNGNSQQLFELRGKIKGVHKVERVEGPNIPSSMLRSLPFMQPFPQLFSSRLFLKYFGSLTYAIIGGAVVWGIAKGNSHWYMWLGSGFCIFSAFVMLFSMGRVSPAKI